MGFSIAGTGLSFSPDEPMEPKVLLSVRRRVSASLPQLRLRKLVTMILSWLVIRCARYVRIRGSVLGLGG